jgi:uncharacterized protein (DUF488 family)
MSQRAEPDYPMKTSARCCASSTANVQQPLLTVGHGTASGEAISKLLRGANVVTVVDVRTIPKSLRHPQFRIEAMELWIPHDAGATYRWEPALGGFRKPRPDSTNVALRNASFRGYADYMETGTFADALHELLTRTASEQTAILCSESLWWRCHRRLIADAASLLRGVEVLHLMHDGKLRPHVPTEGARVTADGALRYDATFV